MPSVALVLLMHTTTGLAVRVQSKYFSLIISKALVKGNVTILRSLFEMVLGSTKLDCISTCCMYYEVLFISFI
jgi:hypothetical protein